MREVFKNIIAFRQKMRGDISTFQSTVTALSGDFVKSNEQGWSFFDPSDKEFNNRLEGLKGYTKWLENDLMGNASIIEKQLAKPFLDFMKNLETEIPKIKEGGDFNTELIAEFDALFGPNGEINKSLRLTAENLQSYYAAYLQQIIETAKQNADQQIRVLRSNYDNLTIEGKREFARSFNEEIKEDARRFRKALAAGNQQLAREIGESLLVKIQSVKKVYAELIDATEDLSGKRSMQGQASYLTALENEIVQGQPNRQDMSDVGLTQLVADASNLGQETARGFIQEVNADVGRAIGLDFAQGVDEGTREGLDIQSPSKVFKKLGKNSGEGFEIGAVESLRIANEAILAEIKKIKAGIAKELKGIVKPSKLDKFLAGEPSKTLTTKGLDALIYRLNGSFNLKPEHQKAINKLALYGRTQKPSIIRMQDGDRKHKIGDFVDFPAAASFTGKVDEVKKTGSLGYLKLQAGGSLYEVVNPKRGFDVPYGDSSYAAPFVDEDETITSGKYRVIGKKQKTISVNYGENDGIEKLKVSVYQLEEIQSKISQFIEECCILEDNACEQTYLINARYRLWVKRHTALEESKALNKYLDDKFPKTRIWNKVTKTAQLSVKGIRLNDKPYYFPNNPPNEYDKFIEDMCKKHHKSLNTHEVKKDNDKIYCFFCNKNITRQQLFIHKRTKKHTRNYSQLIGEIFNII